MGNTVNQAQKMTWPAFESNDFLLEKTGLLEEKRKQLLLQREINLLRQENNMLRSFLRNSITLITSIKNYIMSIRNINELVSTMILMALDVGKFRLICRETPTNWILENFKILMG